MPFAFGHLVFAWLIGKILVKTRIFEIKRPEWFLLLFGALFPDIDFIAGWVFGTNIHRTFTHSLFMAFAGFLLIYFVCIVIDRRLNGERYGLFFSFGILSHIIADMVLGYPGIPLLWPLTSRFWFFGYVNNYIWTTLTYEQINYKLNSAIFDMGLGVLWIGYLFFKEKLKEF
ncbi:metal-dependent hydrolase [Candidatus Woesearchaeota archaeon]|nr:metal-dependent hydrolase [Candidatus Woesearchaeota archaeon]